MENQNEIWKTINGFEEYEISNLGNVRSKDRIHYDTIGRKVLRKSILLQPIIRKGYYHVSLYKNRKLKIYKIHRLVAENFIININNKPQVNHINGIKSDNRVENLEWCTNFENIRHAIDNNLIKHAFGEKHGISKLKTIDVLKIIELSKTNISVRNIAKMFGICAQTAHNIIDRKTWKHLTT